MTTDKTTGKTAAVKALLIKAWRERWTASQYGTHVKALLGRSVSGDVHYLADSLINLALNGPAPNGLLLSLLDHSLGTQIVSYQATLASISQQNCYQRPHCTHALLDLVLQHRPYITSRGKGEECVQLGVSLVSLATWVVTVCKFTMKKLMDIRDSKIDVTNLQKSVEVIECIVQDNFIFCLFHIGRLENQDNQKDFNRDFAEMIQACEQMASDMYLFMGQDTSLQNRLENCLRKIAPSELPKIVSTEPKNKTSFVYTIYSLLAYDVQLQPTSDLSQLAGQLEVIMTIRNVPFSSLVCEVTRCCLLAMNEHEGMEVLRWDAFTLIKLHKLIDRLVRGPDGAFKRFGGNDVFKGLLELLEHSALLDTADAKCKANIYELIIKTFSKENKALLSGWLISDDELTQLIGARSKQLELRQALDLKPPPDSREVSQIVKADSTIDAIIQTFDNKNSNVENLLSVMYHIVKGSSFDLLISAGAANGKLGTLVSKLIIFNEGCKDSICETVRLSQSRAAMFDVTFLMLVHIVQCFGSDVVPNDDAHKNTFFASWTRNCMVEANWVKPLSNFVEQESDVNALLQEIHIGELRTHVIRWNHVCFSVHGVMKEILNGCEAGVVSKELFNRMLGQLGSKLCCLPICIVSWLASDLHYGNASRAGIGSRPSAASVADALMQISGADFDEAEGLPHHQIRCSMMCNVIKKMKLELEEPSVRKDTQGGVDSLSLELDQVWEHVWTRGRTDNTAANKLARLFDAGGPEWLVEVLVDKMTSQVYSEEVSRCCEIVFSLLHIDLPACTLALLIHTLPKLLSGDPCDERLIYPAGHALARLTVSCLSAVLKMKNANSYSRKRKFRVLELEDMCNSPRQPVKLRKLINAEPQPVDHNQSQERLIQQAHMGLFQLLQGVGQEPVISPKLDFVISIIEEGTKLGLDECKELLSHLSPGLLTQLIKLQPERFTMEMILRIFNTGSTNGRKLCARQLCLFRNSLAAKKNVNSGQANDSPAAGEAV